MKILIATHNKSKFELYKSILENDNISVISLNDINSKLEVEETGVTAIENAIVKVKSYGSLTNITTICVDDSLNLDNIPCYLNPGVNIRRVNNKVLTDEEMINYYSNLVSEYGSNNLLKGRFVKGLAVYHNGDIYSHEFLREIVMTSVVSKEINEGYPLNSVIIDTTTNKYISQHNDNDKKIVNDKYYLGVKKFVYDILNS